MDRRTFLAAGMGASILSLPRGLLALAEAPPDELDRRVRDLVAALTLDEKIALMAGKVSNLWNNGLNYGSRHPYETPGCPRLSLPGIRFIDGPRGINFEGSTCFPVSMGRGAGWDPALEERVGEAMGYEARARGANFFGGVCINVVRHPSWGRSQESFGEDPHLLGRMGVGLVTGAQNHVMACAKHFAANSIDRSRNYVDVRMDERTLREIYLPHFKDCVDAGVAAVMNAYNRLNGKQCGHNPHLLRDILKNEWGFRGFVMSDFMLGIKAAVPAIVGGCDVEMNVRTHYGPELKAAVLAGLVPRRNIDDAVTRIVRQQLRFLPIERRGGYDPARIAGPEHAALAREAARRGMVLLKNERRALPLDGVRKLAVIGELADVANLGDHGSSSVRPPYTVTPLAGLQRRAGRECEVIYQRGEDLATTLSAARAADAAVVVAGFSYRDEGEGYDRERIGLAGPAVKLIRAVAEANPRCIVVLEGGGAITMEEWRDRPAAILMLWYPGMEGGNALAEVLFGDQNPGGKLPVVFPKSKDQLYEFDNVSPRVEYGYYHGYRWFDRRGLEPAFPFGFGLSYTGFRYGNLALALDEEGKGGKIAASVEVTNTGARAGEEVVQLYIGYPGSRVDRPVKDLKAFGRVALAPGETKTVTLEVPASNLAYYDPAARAWKVEEIEYTALVGPSSNPAELLSASFRLPRA
jgi:beta-glucosidase